MFLFYYCSTRVSLLSHDRCQYDSLILSKQTWAYPRQHLQQLLWCVVSVRLNLPEVEERKLCPPRYSANCVSTTLTVLILHNVESVYFFYSNPVLPCRITRTKAVLSCGLVRNVHHCVLSMVLQPKFGLCRHVVEVAGSHTIRHTPSRTLLNYRSSLLRTCDSFGSVNCTANKGKS
jgi:hypothetical protein